MPYPPKQAARLAQISVATVKNYVARWPERFSPDATPGPGIPRSYSDRDVATLRTIARLSREGLPTQEIGSRLAEGELDAWEPLESPQEATAGPQATPQPQAALVLVQQTIDALRARELELTERLIAAERRAAVAEALLEDAQRQAARLPWYRRLFGG
jgi:DNA-binding transcriptional MerR regulator